MGPPASSRITGIAAGVLLGLGALLAVVSVRLVLDGRQHLAEGESLARDGERSRALVELEEAARAYVPGSPYPRRAIGRMGIIAKGHEMRGDITHAAAAWESIRRAALSTRHLVQPNRDLLERAERELRRLRRGTRAQDRGEGADPAARPDDPSPTMSLLLFAGLLAWIGGSLALIVLPRRSGGRPAFSPARVVSWSICLGGLALWLAMSWLAG